MKLANKEAGRQGTADKILEDRQADIQEWVEQACRQEREERQAGQISQGRAVRQGRLDQARIQVARQGR
jgi:hypothetical protein